MSFRVITGNIFDVEAEAIVIPANIAPKACWGLDTSAYQIAGYDKMLAARQKVGKIYPGCCEATPAFDLKGKYVLHTVAPVFMRGDWFSILEECYISAFALANDLRVKSIVFPLLGGGGMRMPIHKAMRLILTLLDECPIEATLVITPQQQRNYENSFAEFDSELFDELYTAEVYKRVTHYENIRLMYRKKVSDRNEYKKFQVEQAKWLLENYQTTPEVYCRETFVEYIKQKVGKGKQYTQQEFADLSYIDVGNLNRILNGGRVKITKETALKAAIALELPIDDFKRCIFCSGSSFPCDKTDLIIEECVKENEYDFLEIEQRVKEYTDKEYELGK